MRLLRVKVDGSDTETWINPRSIERVYKCVNGDAQIKFKTGLTLFVKHTPAEIAYALRYDGDLL